MKRWIALLLTVAILMGMACYAEDLEIEDAIIIESEDAEIPVDEAELEIGDIDLSIDDVGVSEADIEEIRPISENVVSVNSSDDFDIQDGVLVKYNGSGGDVVIPDGVTQIGDHAFHGCTSLTSINIPNSVTSFSDYAFDHCTNLKKITIPNSVTQIGEYAFGSCTSLTNITIPNSVTNFGYFAFHNCTSLTSIIIPNSVTIIEWGLFDKCSNLASVTIPSSVTRIDSYAFNKCSSLTSITIPDSVTGIWDGAFGYCQNLASITIPPSVSFFGLNVFVECPNLTIYGEAGSYAESYANKQGIPFVAGSPTPTPTDPTSITLNRQGIVSMMPKKTLQLKATFEPAESSADLKWESRAPKFAKVNSKGKVTALKKGKTTITATTESGLSASVEIWVGQVPVMIKPIVVRKSDNAVEVSWTPLQGVSGYEVAVGKSKNATNASDISGESKKRAILFVTPGQKLYYRVRGYLISGKKKIYGDWSTSKSFTLKRSAESFPAFGGEQFLGSNNMGDVKYTVSLLDWKHEGRTTTIKTRITFEWKKRPNSFGLDALAMGVSGDFTNEENQATVEYVPWNQVGSTGMKAGGYLTDKPKVERSGKGDGVYIKITPSKVYDTYYETTTVRGVKKKVKKKRYTYATTGSIISTWSVDAPEPVTNFSIVGSYGDNQQKVKVDPSVSFTNGAVKFSVSAKLEENFEEGPLAYAKVKLNVQ